VSQIVTQRHLRIPHDAYYTPREAAQGIVYELLPHMGPGWVVDPACGKGALLDAVHIIDPKQPTFGIDIDQAAVDYTAKAHSAVRSDFLQMVKLWQLQSDALSLYISNPPYALAQEFVQKMLSDRTQTTIVACLLRLGFLGSQKRHDWWDENPPTAIRVLSNRPSFTGDGKTDNSEYAWYVWGDVDIAPFGWYSKQDKLGG
jgi:hypothetical protein